MAIICPTVTATEPHEYREQVERVAHFAPRIHLDFMDGIFALSRSPKLEQAWWPHSIPADLHVMYKRPEVYLEQIIKLGPSLVIVHAEAEGDFMSFAEELHKAGISVGVALLADTEAETIQPALESVDHVLIFSGALGHFGGKADLDLLKKVDKLKSWKPELEIGWDGGINEKNAKQLVDGGVDVLNVGGFIQKSQQPEEAYEVLRNLVAG